MDIEQYQGQEDKLWKEYLQTRSLEAKNELITHYLQLVERVVRRMMPVYSQYIEYDDMLGYGVIGLIDAIEKYEPNKNARFETYSRLRIKGEIIDNIRRMDWAPVSLRSKIKLINHAYDELSAQGENPSDEDVARNLDMSVEQVRRIQTSNSMFNVVSLEDILYRASLDSATAGLGDRAARQPDAIVEAEETRRILAQLIGELPEKEQLVVQLYYYEELMIKDIAKVLRVSESRASQIHSKALDTLHTKLKRIYTT